MVIDVRIEKINRAAAFIICIVTSVFIMFSGMHMGVHAEKTGSITLVCKSDSEILSGMTWRGYYVGKRNGNKLILGGAFSGYHVTLKDLSADSLSAAASTLESYAFLDGIKPDKNGTTDPDGKIEFTDLEPGLYLVSGDKLTVGKATYTPAPMFVEVLESKPDVTAYPKFTYQDVLGADSERFKVKKIWENDEQFPQDRAVSVNVEIYCNSDLKETVTLSEKNDWTYEWTAKTGDTWRVIETDIPKNYTVIYRSNETQFVIVNTHDDIPPVTTTTTTATTTATNETTTTDITNTTAITTSSGTNTTTSDDVIGTEKVRTTQKTTAKKTESKLPQTGQLWWPVPVLALGGMIFLGIGFRLIAKSKKEDD